MKYELTDKELSEAVTDWLKKRISINAPNGVDVYCLFKIKNEQVSCLVEITPTPKKPLNSPAPA